MNPSFDLYSENLSTVYYSSLSQVYAFFPRVIGAILILLIGTLIATWIKKLVDKSMELLKLDKVIRNTPIEAFVKHAEFGSKVENLLGALAYWLFMLLVFQTAVSVLGLDSLAFVLDRVLAYVPKVFSAVVILFLGVLVAGILESLVKGSIRSINGQHARLLGKVASYLTLIIFVLASISELGIAQQFIMILFVGFVTTIAVSLGLAVGLGSKDVVGEITKDWYQSFKTEMSDKKHDK